MPLINDENDQVYHWTDDSGAPQITAKADLSPDAQQAFASMPRAAANPIDQRISDLSGGQPIAPPSPPPPPPSAPMGPSSIYAPPRVIGENSVFASPGQAGARDASAAPIPPSVIEAPAAGPAPAPTMSPAIPEATASSPFSLTETQQSVTRKVQEPEAVKAYDKAVTTFNEANARIGERDIAQAAYDKEQAIAKANMIAQSNEQERIKQAAEQSAIDTKQASLDALVQDYGSQKIDSGRFWSNMDTGNKIVAGVALALGAWGQALSQSKNNLALDIIDKAIDRDIDEQKANMAKKGQEVGQARGIYQEFRQKVGDDRTARSMAREAAWRGVAADFDAKSATLKDANAVDAATANGAAATARADKEKMDRTEATVADVKQTKQVAPKETKPLQDLLNVDNARRINESSTQLESATKLKKIVGSPEWQRGAGFVSGNWLKGLAALNVVDLDKEKARLLASTVEADRAKYDILKVMSGSGVTAGEMARYDVMFPDITENPKTAMAKMEAYYETSLQKHKKAYKEVGGLARVSDNPEYQRLYGIGLSPEDLKSKVGFTK